MSLSTANSTGVTVASGTVTISDPNTPSQQLAVNSAGAASVAETTGVLPTGVSQATGGLGLTGLLGAIKGWLDGTLSAFAPKVTATISGSITAQAVGSAAPAEADMIGYKDGSGNSQMVSSATPLPVQMSATPTIDLGVIQIGDGTTETQKLAIDANGKIGINALPGTPAQTADITTTLMGGKSIANLDTDIQAVTTQLGTTGVKVTSLPAISGTVTSNDGGGLPTGVSQATGGTGLTGLLGAIKGWLDGTLSAFAPKVTASLTGSIVQDAVIYNAVAANQSGSAAKINVAGKSTLCLIVSGNGTAAGTIAVSGAGTGGVYGLIAAVRLDTEAMSTTITCSPITAIYQIPVAALSTVQIPLTWSAGTITVEYGMM